ncbi:MAG TPA: alpha-galactosidase [Gemmatimonadaceae bacterium]|nr:alpha-galactosidase [Gemmatimonadaceae bacterium]
MRRWSVIIAALIAGALPARAAAQSVAEPPNAPAVARVRDGRLTLTYGGRVVFSATIVSTGGPPEALALVDTAGDAVTQVLKWTVRGGARLTLTGTVHAGAQAFACATEPRANELAMVRNSVGPSDNRLNRAVYDRQSDWVLSVDEPTGVTVTSLAEPGDSTAFALRATGSEIILRFRPRFYQKHRGLSYYRPWTYDVWHRSVAGWTSWFAFLDKVTEQDVHQAADVMHDVLQPFGYDYLQIDDGYEQEPIGTPAHWLHPNAKFPSGLDGLARYIAHRGLAPGIWTNASFGDSAYVFAHKAEFVATADGAPAYGNWVGYVMDASNPATLDHLVRPVYDSLARMGWRYYKLDALRHLRYEGYNSHAGYFRARGLHRVDVYRRFVQTVRDAIGPQAFLLACWGIRPELIGLVDAVRVGTDGFGYGGFAEYNSYNNVVWRNDPDHIQLAAPDAYRAATLASLTGSLLMLTDRPEVYRTARAEIAKRTAPVLFTRPEQLYDVDPSRSALVGRAATEVSGSGPRAFDADQRLTVPLYLLDVNRPFERWSVLARTGGADTDRIRFADLGLDPARAYLVFEFWSRTLLGAFHTEFAPGPIDATRQVQVFCIRERVPHPQLVATNRHVSCGGPDLERLSWSGDTLSGTSALVGNDEYDIYLTEPAGFRLAHVAVTGAELVGTSMNGSLRVVRLRSGRNTTAAWSVRYTR